jgi:hypothetical protein
MSEVVLTLTREQANALLVAAMAGRPSPGDPTLDEAVNALSAALSRRPETLDPEAR